jgi:capsule polysaccharide export protein KpsE/RkpR
MSSEKDDNLIEIQTQLYKIQLQLQQTQTQLTELKDDLSELKQHLKIKLNDISKNTEKMDDHISFVEDIYNVVKNPFQKALGYYYGNNVELANPKRIE